MSAAQQNRIRDAGSRASAEATVSERDDSLNGGLIATSGPEAASSQGTDYADYDRQRAIDQGYGMRTFYREPFE